MQSQLADITPAFKNDTIFKGNYPPICILHAFSKNVHNAEYTGQI